MLAKLKIPDLGTFQPGRKLAAAEQALAEKNTMIKRLQKHANALEQKHEYVRKKLVCKDETIKTLRDRVETLKFGLDRREIDPIDHNTAAGMDAFFANIRDLDPYLAFGRAIRSLLDRHEVRLQDKRVVEFGTGPGIALKACLEGADCAKVVGHDFSKSALDFASRHFPEATFSLCDIYEGGVEAYDVVFCTEVLEHLEEPERALATLVRMTKPGGHLLLTVPDGRRDFSLRHINFWSPESWRLFLEREVGASVSATGTFKIEEEGHLRHNYAVICPERRASTALPVA